MVTKNIVREILVTELGFDVAKVRDDEPLFSSGLLDSLSSLRLLLALETSFDVPISPLDVSLDDVDSIEKIAETVDKLKQ